MKFTLFVLINVINAGLSLLLIYYVYYVFKLIYENSTKKNILIDHNGMVGSSILRHFKNLGLNKIIILLVLDLFF